MPELSLVLEVDGEIIGHVMYVWSHIDADDPDSDVPYFPCKELQEGFLDGITGSYRDPEPYFVAMRNPEAFEKYDKEFPYKEKLVLPGQLG